MFKPKDFPINSQLCNSFSTFYLTKEEAKNSIQVRRTKKYEI